MADDVQLQILPGPQIALTSRGARVRSVKAQPLALPSHPPHDGAGLWATLPSDVQQALAELHMLETDEPVPLWLDVQLAEVAAWPWELLVPPGAPGTLAFGLAPKTPLVRFVAAGRAPAPRPGVPRLLAVAAAPRDEEPIDVAPLLERIAALHSPQRLAVTTAAGCDPERLQVLLRREQPDVLVIIAHGAPGAVILEDGYGDGVPLTAAELAGLAAGTPLRAVVLASCDGATPHGDAASTAEALLHAGVLGVAAMRGKVSTQASEAFLGGLLGAVIDGQPLERAVVAGRQAILARHGEQGEWHVPICWQRALHRPLALAPPAVMRRGAGRLLAQAPALAAQLEEGGALGLLAAEGLAPLLKPAAGGRAPAPTLVALLEDLGLGAVAHYISDASPTVARSLIASDQVAGTLQELVRSHADAAEELAGLALSSGAIARTVAAINTRAAGHEALLAGLKFDLHAHGATLGDLRGFLADELTGLRADMRAALQQGARIEVGVTRVEETTDRIERKVDDLRDGPERERRERFERQRRDYLRWVVDRCQAVGRARLTERPRSGSDGKPVEMYLQDVYTALTTERWLAFPRGRGRYTPARIGKAHARINGRRNPGREPPARVLRLEWGLPGVQIRDGRPVFNARDTELLASHREPRVAWQTDAPPDNLDPELRLPVRLARPELVVEAIAPVLEDRLPGAPERRLVLLGQPGSGKSTALRYVSVLLAQALLGERPLDLPGWQAPRLPILVPLGKLYEPLSAAGDPADVLREATREALRAETGGHVDLVAALDEVLREAVLLFDGLDELPNEPGAQGESPRLRAARAIRMLGRAYRETPIVVTCRVVPYEERAGDPGQEAWQFDERGWEHRTVQPFAFGQVQAFVYAWYRADARLVGIAERDANVIADRLIDELRDPKIAESITAPDGGAGGGRPAASPLLLTMLTIRHANDSGRPLPRTRDELYEDLVILLLQRWEPNRSEPLYRRHDILSEMRRIVEPYGLREPKIETLRDSIHKLAYDAHRLAPQAGRADGRGYISAAQLEGELLRLFRDDLRYGAALAGEVQKKFLDILEKEAGLLQAPDRNTYAFPHLTFQEYLAACYLADRSPDEMTELLYAAWESPDADRWRVVIALLVGRLTKGKVHSHARAWLDHLTLDVIYMSGEHRYAPVRTPKTPLQRQRDALLAAECLAQLTEREALLGALREEYERKVRSALHSIVPADRELSTTELHLIPAERSRAAVFLARLGTDDTPADTRPGVCALPASHDDPGYWAELIPAGMYEIGTRATKQGDEQARRIARLRLSAFRVARYPVTVWQFRQFVNDRGYERDELWSEQGRPLRGSLWPPYRWDDPDWTAGSQPVIGVSWYEAAAFCRWLDVRGQAEGWLPADLQIRLPSEAQWEVAAVWDVQQGKMRPWAPPEGELWQNCEEAGIGRTSAVGLFPQGASPCGALDMAGNAWEWCASAYEDYPRVSATPRDDFDHDKFGPALRGGAYYLQNNRSGWGARNWNFPDGQGLDGTSFRVCVCSRSAV